MNLPSLNFLTDSREQEAWNEAYARLTDFLGSFALSDRAYVSRLALDLLDQARRLHRDDPSRHPTTVTLELAQNRLTEWLEANLGEQDKSPSQLLADGSIALLLSRVFRTSPTSFLASPLPEELRQALQESLLVTGPDLHISSMTPRHLDYGPMLHLARQTWHRWNGKSVGAALIFWACIYSVLYWFFLQWL